MFYVGEFSGNLVVYHFCEVLSYKKWTLDSRVKLLTIFRSIYAFIKITPTRTVGHARSYYSWFFDNNEVS